MPAFVHPLWGYALDYPDGWVWQEDGEVVAFAQRVEALSPVYDGPAMGKLAVRLELNPYLRPLEPLWGQYITRVGIMRGAKKLGASPFSVGRFRGYEAELHLPAKENRRLWVGLLMAGGIVVHLMLTHRQGEEEFAVAAKKALQTLRFVAHTESAVTPSGVPYPRAYRAVAPQTVVAGVSAEQGWEAYQGEAPIAALQAFYLRELPRAGWETEAFFPFPNRDPEVRFASFVAHNEHEQAVVTLVPHQQNPIRAHIAIRISPADEA